MEFCSGIGNNIEWRRLLRGLSCMGAPCTPLSCYAATYFQQPHRYRRNNDHIPQWVVVFHTGLLHTTVLPDHRPIWTDHCRCSSHTSNSNTQ